jgi:glucose-1-phosphate thymidylyltransferase
MKALILAGGSGTRLSPLTNFIAKQLLPVGNKPILFYAIEQIKEAGISDIGIIISPKTGLSLKSALPDGAKWDVNITYILQSQPLGLAHAVKTAQEFLADSPFLLFLGDNLIKDGVKDLVKEFDIYSPDALIVLKKVDDPRAFGVAEVDSSGKVIQVIEKPRAPKSNLALVGVYIFTPIIHEAIARIKPSKRGEYELTDAIQKLLDMGKEVRSYVLQGWWLDAGKKEDLLEANRIILDEYSKHHIYGEVDAKSQVIGPVDIEKGTKIEDSLIRGPVFIAGKCRVINSIIGPYTSIDSGNIIKNSSIESSIVLNNSYIIDSQHFKAKIIAGKIVI